MHIHTQRGVAKPNKGKQLQRESKTGDNIYRFKVFYDNMTSVGEECSRLPFSQGTEALFQLGLQQTMGRLNTSGTL